MKLSFFVAELKFLLSILVFLHALAIILAVFVARVN